VPRRLISGWLVVHKSVLRLSVSGSRQLSGRSPIGENNSTINCRAGDALDTAEWAESEATFAQYRLELPSLDDVHKFRGLFLLAELVTNEE